jgi:acyl carrier protein
MPPEHRASTTEVPVVSEEEIARFVAEHFLDDDTEDVDAEEDLLARGVMDSLGVLHVAAWLEKRYAITLPDDELTIRNLHSVRTIRETAERAAARAGEP